MIAKTCAIILVLLLGTLNSIFGQATSKLRYEIGSGISLLGSGDVLALNIENELDYTLSNHFESSISILYGRGFVSHDAFSISFIQGNLNLVILPFGNKSKYTFKFGGGLSFQSHHEVSSSVGRWEDGEFIVLQYNIENSKTVGYNLTIENSFKLSEKYSLGFKLFGQIFANEDTNFGGILKIGYRL